MEPAILMRRTELSDAPAIAQLIQLHTEAIFGRVNLVHLIEKSVFSVTAVDQEGHILGFASLYDGLDPAGISLASWETWFADNYADKTITPFNSLTLRYGVAHHSYESGVLSQLLKTVFVANPEVEHCLLAVGHGSLDQFHKSPIAEYFTHVKPKMSTLPPPYEIYECTASRMLVPFNIRIARVEDFDDLVPIFNRQSNVLKQYFGEFFLNDIIEAQNATNKALVFDVGGKARGFMSISCDVDSTVLNECFDLTLFDNLKSTRKVARAAKKVEPEPSNDSLASNSQITTSEANMKRSSVTGVKTQRVSIKPSKLVAEIPFIFSYDFSPSRQGAIEQRPSRRRYR